MIDTYDMLLSLHANLSRWAEEKEKGDAHAADVYFDAAENLLNTYLGAARAEGREAAAEEAAAGDGEPDVSDEGFDPYLNTYTDDC